MPDRAEVNSAIVRVPHASCSATHRKQEVKRAIGHPPQSSSIVLSATSGPPLISPAVSPSAPGPSFENKRAGRVRTPSKCKQPRLSASTAQSSIQANLTQEIQYCRAPDGVRLAWAKVGRGPPLMRAANWLTHLEYDWESPLRRPALVNLANNHTLIRYDARGTGLSDWDVDELSLDAWVSDLAAVADAAGLKRFPLL